MLPDGQGNFYVCGTAPGLVDFSLVPTSNSWSEGRAFVAKYDGNYNLLWLARLDGDAPIQPNALALSPNENLLITGSFLGTADFDPGPNLYQLIPPDGTNSKAFLLELSSSGQFQRAIQFEGTGSSEAKDLSISPDSSVCLTGRLSLVGLFSSI